MSNRTKIKKKASAPPKQGPVSLKQDGEGSKRDRNYWQPPQTVLASVIFLTLGAVLLAKSLYIYLPAGLVLIGVMGYSAFVANRTGSSSKGRKFILTPAGLVAVLIIVRVYSSLHK